MKFSVFEKLKLTKPFSANCMSVIFRHFVLESSDHEFYKVSTIELFYIFISFLFLSSSKKILIIFKS